MAPVESVQVSVYRVPTDRTESDGTLEWSHTTMVCVQVAAADRTGVGYTYCHGAAGVLIRDVLAGLVVGRDTANTDGIWNEMRRQVRNLGACGIAAMAISAVDVALWDLKARLLGHPLVGLLGSQREGLPVYGSGGFTSYTDDELERQLGGWVENGIPRVKMKVGREPERDLHRVKVARHAIGPRARLFVDANSAYDRRQALGLMHRFADGADVSWMEQPLPPEDRPGMRFLRDHGPAAMDVADGEYAYGPEDIRTLIESDGVDVVQADITRCGGITGLLRIAAYCDAHKMPLSLHCAPLLHLHVGCAVPALRHAEYFHDHVRIERRFFDGFPEPRHGVLHPDPSRPGLGFSLKAADAEPFRIPF